MENSPQSSPKRSLRYIWIALVLALIAGLAWGYSWASYARPPLDDALAALESGPTVQVASDPWLIFTPAEGEPTTGLIFYPGGRVDPRGYAPLLREIAAGGYLVVAPSMPLNMAIFNPGAAKAIISRFSEIERWSIAGHSVGGVSAAIFASRNPEHISGLAFWAAYPAGSSDLSEAGIPVYSIYGTLDPQADPASVQARANLLPSDAVYVSIEGGDHHQFGSYLIEPGEHLATISKAAQHEQIIQATLKMLDQASQYK